MASNDAFTVADSSFGPVGLVAPLVPDVTLVHGAVADRHGNVALSEPLLEGVWGAWAARRGVVATVERVVDDLDGLGHRVAHPRSSGAGRRRSTVRCPSRGPVRARSSPSIRTARTSPFWSEARHATRRDFDAWARQWVLEPTTHDAYLDRVGRHRLDWLSARTDPESWRADAEAHPVDASLPPSRWEHAAAYGRERLEAVAAGMRCRRRVGRRRGRQPGRLGGGGEGARRGQRSRAHRRARHVGLHPHAGRSLHLQPPRLPRDAHARRRVDGARHGGGRDGHAHHRLPRARPRSTGTGTSTRP